MWRKATYYRSASVAALVIASAIAMTRIAAAADITYDVNQTIGAGSVTGTITTDGTIGPLSSPLDIVGFDLTTTVGSQTATLMSGVNGGTFSTVSSGITATPTALEFDFSRMGTTAIFFTSPSTTACAPIWSLRTAGGSSCNSVSGNVNSVQAVRGGDIATVTGTGMQTIATVETPEIPLPPAIYLFGGVLGGAFWMSRRKRSAVSTLGA